MDSFIVSARKYRPLTFDTVVGQQSITTTLKNAIRTQQVAQAFLFTGPRGVGKTTCARILAKTINCENITPNIEPCNQCASCKSFSESASFNIHELDAASNNSVDDIRSLIDQVRIPPQVGRYKVYIIDEVHMLSPAAFNAFLKTLEEPPAYAKFILATTEKHKILPTILSRCQVYDFHRITVDDIARHLEWVANNEQVNYEKEALHVIAQKADGALRDALSIFDQIVNFSGANITYKSVIENLNVLDYEYYFRLTSYLLAGDIPQSLMLFNEITEKGFDGHHFVNGFATHLRDILVCKDASTVKLLEVSENTRELYLEQASQCPVPWLVKCLELTSKTDQNYKIVANKRLHVELMLMQMCNLNNSPQPANAEHVIQKTPQSTPVTTPRPTTSPTPKPVTPAQFTPVNSSFSIKKELQQSQKPDIPSITQEEKVEYVASKPLEKESLQSTIIRYADEIADNNKPFSISLKNNPIDIKGTHTILITLDNKLQNDKNTLAPLLNFLRKELLHPELEIETIINETISKPIAMSQPELFNFMAEKNPELKNLKDNLDLKIDY